MTNKYLEKIAEMNKAKPPTKKRKGDTTKSRVSTKDPQADSTGKVELRYLDTAMGIVRRGKKR